jgi:sugar porter (SP) family MFS transporter
MGSFQFGYQTGVISGAILFIEQEFHLTTFQQELVVSSVLIGCFLGALSAGISDFLGRKKTVFITLVVFFISINCLSSAHSLLLLLIGRVLVGFAIGLSSVTVPLYLAEIAPPESRGKFVSMNQLFITIGILVAFWMAYLYSDSADWRDMFAISYIPAVIQLLGLFFIPETPSWLMSQGKSKAAEKVLRRLRLLGAKEYAADLETHRVSKKASFLSFFSPEARAPILIGVGISMFQQITGINTVIYYAPRMFQYAGFATAQSAIYATIWVGVVNVIMTLLGLWLVDRAGRRSLALIGIGGMLVSLAFMGTIFMIQTEGVGLVVVIGLLAYISFFAVGLGIVTWLIISEIYPLGIRARAMSAASFVNWSFNYLVSLTFLTLIQLFGVGGTYWIYAVVCLFAFWFVWKKVPETKGKTFQQIQAFWHK